MFIKTLQTRKEMTLCHPYRQSVAPLNLPKRLQHRLPKKRLLHKQQKPSIMVVGIIKAVVRRAPRQLTGHQAN
jgi:hypothetical protein